MGMRRREPQCRELCLRRLGNLAIRNQDFKGSVSVSRNRHIWRKALVSEVWLAPVLTSLSSLIGLDVTESASDPCSMSGLTPPVEYHPCGVGWREIKFLSPELWHWIRYRGGYISKLRWLQDVCPSRGSVAAKLALCDHSLIFHFTVMQLDNLVIQA